MPQYISLADQGFWIPFQMLAEKRARRQARQDALAQEARRQQEADRAFDLQKKSADAQLAANELQRQVLKQSLDKTSREDWLRSFDPSSAAGFISEREKAGELWPGGVRPAELDLPGEVGELVDFGRPQALPAPVRKAVTDFGVGEAAKRGLTISPQELERELQARQLSPVPDLSKLAPVKATVAGRDGATVELGRVESGLAQPMRTADGAVLRDMFVVDGRPVHVPRPEKSMSAADFTELQEARRRAQNALDLVTKGGGELVGPWGGSKISRGLNYLGTFASDSSRDEFQRRRLLEALTNELALSKTKFMKGPITEREWPILFRSQPLLTDTPQYWQEYLKNYVAQLDKQLAAAEGSSAFPALPHSVDAASPATGLSHPASPFDAPVFKSVKDAEAAKLPKGTMIRIVDARTGLARPAVIE